MPEIKYEVVDKIGVVMFIPCDAELDPFAFFKSFQRGFNGTAATAVFAVIKRKNIHAESSRIDISKVSDLTGAIADGELEDSRIFYGFVCPFYRFISIYTKPLVAIFVV